MHKAKLSDDSGQFYPNMGFAYTKEDYRTVVNVTNYYGDHLFPGHASDAVGEVTFYDEEGTHRFTRRAHLPPFGSLHVDIGETLGEAGIPTTAMGAVYARLVPEKVPPALVGKRVPTEFTTEITRSDGQGGDFFHNTLSQSRVPTVSRMISGVLFANENTVPRYIILVNNYFGPWLPFLGMGHARIDIVNHRGERRSAQTGLVPPRGLRRFPLHDAFPDLAGFLDNRAGRLEFCCVNLLRKPWIWFEAVNGVRAFCIEHL